MIARVYRFARTSNHSKWLSGLLLVVSGLLFFYFDLSTFFTLDYLRNSHQQFHRYYLKQPVQTIAAYMAVHILITAVSLPGGTLMSLGAGSLFGLTTGAMMVSFSNAIGTTLSMSLTRWFFRDWVQDKFGDQIKKINEGIEQDGVFYLFTLRLLPMIPSFMVNAVMGLGKIKVFTFYWVTQVGTLLSTVMIVNAGSQLSQLETLSDIFSGQMLSVLLGVAALPLTLKFLFVYANKKKSVPVG